MKSLAITFLVLALCAPVLADSVPVSACGCGDDAPAMQQAIATATRNGTVPGTVVLAGNFTFQESLTIDFPDVTLTAASSGASISAPGLTAILLDPGATGFSLTHLTVVARRAVFTPSAATINNVSILENTFDTVTRGVVEFTFNNAVSSGWIIRGNTFFATDTSGCTGGPGCAAILASGVNGVIENNSIQYAGLGLGISVQDNHGFMDVTVDTGSGWSVQGNTIDADVGLDINGGSSNLVAGNHFTQPGAFGVMVTASEAGEAFLGIVIPAEMNKISDNEIRNKTVAGIALGDDTGSNSVLRNTVAMSSGTGIDLGFNFNDVPGITLGPSIENQVHANILAGGDIGIALRILSDNNIVTGNQISTTNPPAQGIVQESTTSGNLVRGNPGFDPLTGSAKTFGAPAHYLDPGN